MNFISGNFSSESGEFCLFTDTVCIGMAARKNKSIFCIGTYLSYPSELFDFLFLVASSVVSPKEKRKR